MHAPLWARFEKCCQEQRLPHAILLVAPWHANLLVLARGMLAALLCKQAEKPCGLCQSCKLMDLNAHPDVLDITADKPYGTIKIDQIRPLQTLLYTGPQLGIARGIIIHTAESMNEASQNALLKILEEPPANTYFLLIAEHTSTIRATILSRCQLWTLPYYPTDSGRGQLLKELDGLLDNLLDAKYSTHKIAAYWAQFELADTIWLLYLLNARMISSYFDASLSQDPRLHKLAKRIGPVRLFRQLDNLQDIIKNSRQTIALNTLLVLETFFLEYSHVN